MKHNSKDDSFLDETDEELLQPYDDSNCFNIFTNNLKLRKKRPLTKRNCKWNNVAGELTFIDFRT